MTLSQIAPADHRPAAGVCAGCGGHVEPVQALTVWLVPDLCFTCAGKAQDDYEQTQRRAGYEERLVAAALPPALNALTPASAGKQARAVLAGPDLAAWTRAEATCNAWQPTQPLGLYLHGKAGTGKSVLAAMALKRSLWAGHWGLFLNVPNLFTEMRRGFGDRSIAQDWIGKAQRMAVTVLDDIGAESPQPWIREALFVLVDGRINAGRPTIYTSNCTPGDLHRHLGDEHGRVVDRIVGSTDLVELNLSESWRLRAATARAKQGRMF